MKVLVITTSYLPKIDGVTRTVSEISRGLCLRGHRVVVLTKWRKGQSRVSGICPEIRWVGIGKRPGESFALTLFLAARAIRIIGKEKIDVVHAHGTIAGISATIVRMVTGKKFIITFHQDALLGWERGYNRIGGIKSNLTRFGQRFVCSRAEFITVQSKQVGEIMGRVLDIKDQSKTVVVANPVDDSRFNSAGMSVDRNEAQLLYVGNLLKRKRIDILLLALKKVREANPNARLVIIGSGPKLDSLHSLVTELGLQDGVVFRGQVSDSELASAYRSAAAFVLPSEAEVFGLVIVEALLSGAPVISTRTAGASSIIDSGSTGLLVPIGDSAELAQAIIEVLSDGPKAQAMAARGQAFAKSHFALGVVCQELERVYRGVAR